MQTVAEDSGVTAMVLHERRQERQADRQRDAVLAGVGLAAAARVLRDSRFEQHVIAGLIVQAALAQMARDALRRGVRRLVAWDNARLAEWENELRRRHEAEGGQLTAMPG
jgi:hypothetical protein